MSIILLNEQNVNQIIYPPNESVRTLESYILLDLQRDELIEGIIQEFSMRFPDGEKVKVMSDRVHSRAEEIQREFRKQGIDLKRVLRPAGTKIKREIDSGFKRNAKPEIVGKNVMKIIVDLIRDIAKSTLGKFAIGLVLLLAMVFILYIPMPAVIGSFFDAFITGPVLEESFKAIAVRLGVGYQFTTIFAGFETYKYIIKLMKQGFDVGTIVKARLVTFVFHLFTTWLQKFMYEKFKDKEGWQKHLSWAGFVIAVILHAMWVSNTFGASEAIISKVL